MAEKLERLQEGERERGQIDEERRGTDGDEGGKRRADEIGERSPTLALRHESSLGTQLSGGSKDSRGAAN